MTAKPRSERPILITGGAGFIGSNLAHWLARGGATVRVLDDLSRPGVERNLGWLSAEHGPRIDVRISDVRDRLAVREAVRGVATVFHIAGQTAVTASLVDPRHDFSVNAAGTLEILEAIRAEPEPPALIYASTNKVYGCLTELPLRLEAGRWRPVDELLATRGIDEQRPLAFRTPYGCSKGAADQYVLDYARSFQLPAAVFRMSCIYGPRQFGTEDQGWLAHFLIRAIDGAPITIYGDGRQVRDVLFIDDLVDALLRAANQITQLRGRVFNIGGGPSNTLSLLELIALIAQLRGRPPELSYEDWREADQRYYVSDTHAFTSATGWTPRISPRTGVEALYGWLLDRDARLTRGHHDS
ncbi:MAG TPA: NAD-dependent epimerase/dehydratase family protein [Kofleriaceae bacterium]|nr:NAD-dependent epimerase/dehydratase family protein [Kofleriaceae bacterium]